MSDLVFMDTETSGLADDDEVWEWAAIRRAPDGQSVRHHLFVEHDVAKAAALPEPFQSDYRARYDPGRAVTTKEFATYLYRALAGRPHIVGACPWFDTGRMGRLLEFHGYRIPYHYHLVDVESVAVGWLGAQGIEVPVPWDSDALSMNCGVVPPTDTRHTAMGDAEWALALYDVVTRPPVLGAGGTDG